MTAQRTMTSVCALLVLAACERSRGVYDNLDEKAPPFVALGPATPVDKLPKITDAPAAEDAKKPQPAADECGASNSS